ncbi:hypothetical protein EDD37DRAFT_639404 [Exophiala viscosa]|uniref:uncharacterized protein n=1 Tax=Exophiala viscosa TaxID=2486360 RepID=UPI0021944D9A|nr:hypothetical protein EDD37DRAFT_639404 [Exophiala viscosa]
MITLFCFCCAWHWALVGLVAWLLAVVAQSLGGCANFRIVADIAALVACTTRKGRHSENVYWISSSVPVRSHVRPCSSMFLRESSRVKCRGDHFPDGSIPTRPKSRNDRKCR